MARAPSGKSGATKSSSDKNTVSAAAGGSSGASPVTYQVVRDMIDDARQGMLDRMATIETSIDQKLSKLDNVPSLWKIASVVGAIVFGGVGVLVAIAAFGGDRFDAGIGYGTNVGEKYIEHRLSLDQERRLSEERYEQLIKRLDELLGSKQAPTIRSGPPSRQ